MVVYRSVQSLVDVYQAYLLVSSLDQFYPTFIDWYWNKAAPDVMLGRASMLLAESGSEIVGVSIARGGNSPKLRCVRVHPRFRSRGLAVHLIDRSLRAIDCDKPELTVPEELIHDYSRILVNRFDFDLMKVDRGLYRPGILEYQFNGRSDQRIVTAYG